MWRHSVVEYRFSIGISTNTQAAFTQISSWTRQVGHSRNDYDEPAPASWISGPTQHDQQKAGCRLFPLLNVKLPGVLEVGGLDPPEGDVIDKL